MSENNKILVVEDDSDLRSAIGDTLTLSHYSVCLVDSAEQALEKLSHQYFALIISDVQMPGMDGHELLEKVKAEYPETPFVLITAYGSVPKAVEAIQAGASDYIIKPFEAEILIEMVNRLMSKQIDTGSMVIADHKSEEIAELARRVAMTDATVMISGESGTGKEVYSKFIHENSLRGESPFVAINCAAIPESMLESILFGYEKGAFTGAYTARAGKFEQANNGTLLLDEISEMDLGLQAKLLRVIQEKEVERLGGNKTIPLNVRIIATTNRNLKQEVSEGNFREDLFYRLNVFPLHLLSLRERRGDIIPLARKFVESYQPGNNFTFTTKAEEKLNSYQWPGNVRELENVVQRSLILCNGIDINDTDIIFETATHGIENEVLHAPVSNESALESDLKTREKEIIIEALASHSSKKEAAEKLGISPRTLRYKLAQFRKEGISIPPIIETARAS